MIKEIAVLYYTDPVDGRTNWTETLDYHKWQELQACNIKVYQTRTFKLVVA